MQGHKNSTVIPLLFTILEPLNLTIIDTFLCLVAEQCKKQQQNYIVTFGHTIFMKSVVSIIVSQAKGIDVLYWVTVFQKDFPFL